MKKLTAGARKLHAIRRTKKEKHYAKTRKFLQNKIALYETATQALNAFQNLNIAHKSTIRGKRITISIPQNFSFIDNPRESVSAIQSLANATSQNPKCREIVFDHSGLSEHDLAAEKVLDHIAQQIRQSRKNKRPKLNLKGVFPSDPGAARFIRGVGIVRALGLEKKYTDPKDLAALRIFVRAHNKSLEHVRNPSTMSPKDIAAKKYIDHIDECLGRVGLSLTDEGVDEIGQVVGEILDNVIEHSGANDWVVCGYLDSEDESNMCELVVFNFGKSIAKSFLDLPRNHYMWGIVAPFITEHQSKGFFGENWRKEDLLTLIALQENISSKNESEDDTRGVGTADLLEFFQGIHEERSTAVDIQPKMAILSGTSHIVLDGKYKMRNNTHGRRVIAFNDENDLSKKPDKNYFTDISPYEFPGTAICLRFGLAKNSVKTNETED